MIAFAFAFWFLFNIIFTQLSPRPNGITVKMLHKKFIFHLNKIMFNDVDDSHYFFMAVWAAISILISWLFV